MAATVTETPEEGAERVLEIHAQGDSVFLTRSAPNGQDEFCMEFDRGEFRNAVVAELGSLEPLEPTVF
jgi:hypothetical protein